MKLKYLFFIPLSLVIYTSCSTDNEQDLGFREDCTENIQNVSFSLEIQPIFSANCAIPNCHAGPMPKNGYNFTDYNGIVNVDDFELISAVNHAQGFEPMPRNAAKLPACDIKRIEVWISEGEQNN